VLVRVEQAVYGSFAFLNRGYAILSHSPGCRPEWLDAFRSACQNLGELPARSRDESALFALRLPGGPCLVVGVSSQGRDDHGRPGALAFHGLFVSPRDYRRLGASPFALTPLLRSDWSPETRALPALTVALRPEPSTPATDPRAAAIAETLRRGRRVALESPAPIDDLARDVWRALPRRVRGRASVATWACGNGLRFDLFATPRLAGLTLDASYREPTPRPPRPAVPRLLVALGATAVLAGAALGLVFQDDLAPSPASRVAATSADDRPVNDALSELATRIGLDVPAPASPSERITLLAARLRYEGPLLTDAELTSLRADPGHDAALALRWDAFVRKFAGDRPLPADLDALPLPDRLAALAWSLHSDLGPEPSTDGPRRGPVEFVQALGESLSPDLPLRPTRLSERYPALVSYLSFLRRLPRR
jgi:hypothetical protein